MIRIVENNDWVIFTLLGGIAMYIMMFYWMLKGESVWRYLSKTRAESSNNFPTWLVVSGVYLVVLSVLISQYVSVLPRFIGDIQVNGWKINKIGMMIMVLFSYYLMKSIITLIFYKAIRQPKRWLVLMFVAQRFYFVKSLVLIVLSIVHYYFPIDRLDAYDYYFMLLIILFVAKNLFYFFHKEESLPKEWYYKILYICTLQILPLLAVWKLLFL